MHAFLLLPQEESEDNLLSKQGSSRSGKGLAALCHPAGGQQGKALFASCFDFVSLREVSSKMRDEGIGAINPG
jgi:hypothetical protein